MKLQPSVLALFFMLTLGAFAGAETGPQEPVDPAPASEEEVLKTSKEKASYSIGNIIGENFRKQGAELDQEKFMLGLKHALENREALVSKEEREEILAAYRREVAEKLLERGKKEGEAFLAANKEKEGVLTTESGLQYLVIKEGTGPTPQATDQVRVHYRGTLIDGTKFDSSYDRRGLPAVFPVGRVIRGWQEVLKLMKVGAKWKIFIPSDLAYGEGGRGNLIGPNATLIFEMELLGIEEPPKIPQGSGTR